MKVLMVHNRYQQRGGEDSVVDAETGLLTANGIEVRRFDANNDALHGLRAKLQVSASQFGSPSIIQGRLTKELSDFRPDVVHVHNWFPTISASIFSICRRAGIPVVNTLHNYRLLCINATLFRDGEVCEDCVGTTFRTPGISHRCYRQSTVGSLVATAGMLAHWAVGTWHNIVDKFIALSEFSRGKFIEGGLPAEKIVVKSNFVDPDPGRGRGDGNYFLFVGRLTEENGIRTLLQCWRMGPDLPLLKIVGTGPLQDEVSVAASSMPNVEWLGNRESTEVSDLMGRACATLCPSLWYEGMPRVVVESFAVGTPVVASKIGSYPEMIAGNGAGLLIPAGDAHALRDAIRSSHSTNSFASMRTSARSQFEAKYTGSTNLSAALNIYRSVLYTDHAVVSTPATAGAPERI